LSATPKQAAAVIVVVVVAVAVAVVAIVAAATLVVAIRADVSPLRQPMLVRQPQRRQLPRLRRLRLPQPS